MNTRRNESDATPKETSPVVMTGWVNILCLKNYKKVV
jgi:hypothetical protein